ncbi:hypothetical protein EHQ12_07925 [Leptospira gomenensis]|uniref:Tetratricopeptide repeat protein n=1 Tax=Leptospira gomenensis TaxID=2484974 RepID=A0A5F1YDJ3_9LEPT|nr:hypothetical protein [Leptospira gomenensis]TGK36006.1 hypothetical protein EHQ17_05370 [Leptospira gomenensis]TGK39962.1 hypothetical protein EHQ12_07925 [Leptospira gomenensis]TGK51412.1 hypothetical protein EHQ07_02315 [Leptospira gomenensis]TGK64913.1 hypothetical protein EHQ13_06640 [Leptospira gomenensis]
MDVDSLAARIEETTLSALEDGTIDRESLRQIVIGVSTLGDEILLWGFDNWSDYPWVDEGDAYAHISNSEWLDRWDELDDPTGTEANELRPRLRKTVKEAVRQTILKQSLGEFSSLLGFAEHRLNPHADIEHGVEANIDDSDLEGEVFAFYHPYGADGLVGMMEKIPPNNLIYPFGAFFENGIALFYPDGQQDSLSDSEDAPGIKIISFEELEAWWYEDSGNGGVIFRIKNEPLNSELSGGHTHEEWGQPDRSEIDGMIREHFRKNAAQLLFQPDTLTEIENEIEVRKWTERIERYEIHPASFVNLLLGRLGFDKTLGLLTSFQNEKLRERSVSLFAETLLEQNRNEEFLRSLSALGELPRLEKWTQEIRALIRLDLREETDRLIETVQETAATPSKRKIIRKDEILPWEIVADFISGRKESASKKILSLKEKNSSIYFVQALLLQDSDAREARNSLLKSLQSEDSDLGLERFITEPGLKKWIEAAKKDKQRRKDAFELSQNAQITTSLVDTVSAKFRKTEIRRKTKGQWKLCFETEIKEKIDRSRMNPIYRCGSEIWVTDSQGLSLLNEEGPEKYSLNPSIQGEFSGIFVSESHLYALVAEGLKIYNIQNGHSPSSLGTVPRLNRHKDETISGGTGFIATLSRETCTIYSTIDPSKPMPVSCVTVNTKSQGYIKAIAGKGNFLFITTNKRRIIGFDLSNTSLPRCAFDLEIPWDGENGYGELWILGNILVVKIHQGVWVVEVSDPGKPVSRAAFIYPQLETAIRNEDKLYLVNERGSILTFDLTTLNAEEITNIVLPDGKIIEDYEKTTGTLLGERIILFSSHNIKVLEYSRIGFIPNPIPNIEELESRLKEEIEKNLSDLEEESEIGLIVLRRYKTSFRMILDRPRSFVGIGAYRENRIETEWKLSELIDSEAFSDYDQNRFPAEIKDQDSYDIYSLRFEETLNVLIERILRWLPSSESFRRIASGKVYLCVGVGEHIRWIHTYVDSDREWKPFRSETIASGRTVDELLKDFNVRDRMIERAIEEPEVRERAYVLAGEGDLCAFRIVQSIQNKDRESAIRTFQQTALTDRDCAVEAVEELSAYKDRMEVKEFLEHVAAKARTSVRLEAAVALGRGDSDEVLNLVKRLLKRDTSLQEIDLLNDFEFDDLAVKTMKGIEKRIVELQPDLLEWIRENPHNNRLAGIAVSLFRAGYRSLPPELLEQAEGEKYDEEYHNMTTGIDSLDKQDWSQSEVCFAERLFTGYRLAEYVGQLRDQEDKDSSLWPPELKPEPWSASWSYVLDSSLPHLREMNLLDWFEDELGKRAGKSGDRYSPDRSLLAAILKRYSSSNDFEATIRIASYYRNTEGNAFNKKETDYSDRIYTWAKVQLGFKSIQEGNLTRARELATEVLTRNPAEGTALFLDARLFWLERGSASECIERAKENLEKLSPDDKLGRGRILNLVGCALDDLKDWEQAAVWFEKAWKAHSSDPNYLSNLAEAHFKRGAIEEASKTAQLARRSGSKAEILDEILGNFA